MLANDPTIIVGDPGIMTISGLPAIDYMRDPLEPQRKRKTGKIRTKQADFIRMLKMSNKDFLSYCSGIMCPDSLRSVEVSKSMARYSAPHPTDTDLEAAISYRKHDRVVKRMRGEVDTQEIYLND